MVYLNNDGTLKATQASGIGNTILYTGRRLDTETGLYYFRARHYDSTLGRFVGRDPIGYEGSKWSLYEYCESTPFNLLDPSGTEGLHDPLRDPVDTGKLVAQMLRRFRYFFASHYQETMWEADNRKGNGPWKGSAGHCWAGCVTGFFGAVGRDGVEALGSTGDWVRDIVAQHWGNLCYAAKCNSKRRGKKVEDICDECCATWPTVRNRSLEPSGMISE